MARPKGTVVSWEFSDLAPISKIVAAARRYPRHKLFMTDIDDGAEYVVFARNKKEADKLIHDPGAETQGKARRWRDG